MEKIKNTIQGKFAKNILLVVGGTAFAQVISVVTSPIITRIYMPNEYGVLAIYTSVLSLFSGSQSLRYELGIPIAEDDETAINLVFLSLLIPFILSLAILLLVFFWGETFLDFVSASKLYEFRMLIPIGVLLSGIYQTLTMWSFRRKDFRVITKTKVKQSIGGNLTKIILGIVGLGPLGLILGSIIGGSTGITSMAIPIIKNEKRLLKKISIKKILNNVKKFIKFPIYSLPSTMLSKISSQLPIFFIATFFGEDIVGYYGFSLGIVNIPLALIGNSVGDVFYGEAASIGKSDPKRLRDISSNLLKKLIAIGVLPFIFLLLFSPYLFAFVFGSDWTIAGEYVRILSISSFFQLIFQPVSRIFDIYGKQNVTFYLSLLRIISTVSVFIIANKYNVNGFYSILAFSVVMSLIHALTYLYAQYILKIEISNASR